MPRIKLRRLSAALLAMALVATLIPLAGPAGAVGTFDDDDGNIHESNIEAIAALGITLGCNPPANNLYCPDDYVTRQQMASFLVRTFDLAPGPSGQFTDTAGSVHEADINALAASGITRGCNPPANDRYCPTELVTRGQMAAFMARGLGLDDITENFFVDDNGNIFERQINAIARVGITRGCNPPANTEYCPQNPVRRDEMASFLSRVAAIASTGTTSTTTPAPTTTTPGSTTTSTSTTTTTIPKPPAGWATVQDLSDPVADAAGAALNGILYVAGGKRSADNRVDDFLAYNPVADDWATLDDLPGPGREDVSLVAANGSIYVFGGASTDPFEGNVTTAASFDPGSGWSTLAALPTGRSGAAAVVYGGDIWLIGGFGPAGVSLSSVLVYDLATNSYSTGPALPSPRDHAGAVVLDGNLYVFGGRNRNGTISEPTEVIRLTSASDQTWETVGQPMPRARRSFVVGVAEGRIQLFGGESQTQTAIDEVDEFNPDNGTWNTSLPDMVTARHGPAGATIGHSTYVVGGSLGAGVDATDVNERFTR